MAAVENVSPDNAGVVNEGLVPNTKAPEPVSSVTAEAKLALDGVAKNVAIPEPKPDTPVEIGRPVQFDNVPEVGVPNNGVVKLGDVDNTTLPVPVLVVTPVPPYNTSSFPPKVTAPVVEVLGVSPVDPALNEDTPELVTLNVEYHCVAEDALNSIHPFTGKVMAAFAAKASIIAPVFGYIFKSLAPLFTTMILLPIIAAGKTMPEPDGVVVTTL